MQSITIDRSYKDGEEFKTTNSFRPQDLPLIEVLMRKTMEYLFLKDTNDYATVTPTELGSPDDTPF